MGRPPPGGACAAIQREAPSSFIRSASRKLRALKGSVFSRLRRSAFARTRRAYPGELDRPRRAHVSTHTSSRDGQRGVTGLETAIIMIAFVVVASVFAMTTLQTGIFSAEQGKQVARSGLDQATGSLQLRGSVRAIRGDIDVDGDNVILLSGVDDQAVAKIIFTVTGALGISMTDLTPPHIFNDTGTDPDASGLENRTSITIQSDSFLINDAAWTVTFPGSDNGDYILDHDERAEITVWLHTYDNVNSLWDLGSGTGDPYIDAATSLIGVSDEFTIQFHPAKGNTLNIQRSLPVVLTPQMDLR